VQPCGKGEAQREDGVDESVAFHGVTPLVASREVYAIGHYPALIGVRVCRMCGRGLERVAGIEPARSAWEADRLPLHHTRRCAVKYAARGVCARGKAGTGPPPAAKLGGGAGEGRTRVAGCAFAAHSAKGGFESFSNTPILRFIISAQILD
jgi:hypothetical protein